MPPFLSTMFKGVKTAGVAVAVGATLGKHRGLKRELDRTAKETARTAEREAKEMECLGEVIEHSVATASAAVDVACTLGQSKNAKRSLKERAAKVRKTGPGAVPAALKLVPGMAVVSAVHNEVEETVRAKAKHDEGTKVLYHHTKSAAARSIVKSQRMRRGPEGELGPAIYLATSKRDARRKAMHGNNSDGVTLVMDVDLGRVRHYSMGDRDWHILMRGAVANRQHELESQGFNSMCLHRDTGIEYAVFDPSRVHNIRVAP